MSEPNFLFIEKWVFNINIFILELISSHSKIDPEKIVMATSLCENG